MVESKEKRSPLTGRSLRNPGQSVEEQRIELLFDKVLSPIMLAVMLVVMAGIEWSRAYFSVPPAPLLYSLSAALAAVYAGYRIWHVRPQLKALRLASEGERVVGQFLDRFREQGFQVFHDLQGKGFNVDHVIVGEKGVFTIETKTYSKPARGESKIRFDGEKILVDGFLPDRNCVVQARAQANWLKNLILESTGRKVFVRPAIVYPGWYIDGPPAGLKTDVWVLNPKGLPGFISHQPQTLSPEDVKLIGYHISRYIRTATE